MARIVPIALLAGALLASGLSAAQAQEAAAPGTIDVMGRKAEEVRQEAKDFIRRTGVADRPVARWVDPVCPQIIGVSAEIARMVDARIREIAKDAKIRLARRPCDGNLIVSFVSDASFIVREIAEKSPSQLTEVSSEARALLVGGESPVRWWHTSHDRTADGMGDIGNDAPPAVFARQEQPGGSPLGGNVYQQYRSSFLSTQMVRALRSATIIVDVNKATGMPLESVAAFAALVGLAEIEINEETPPNSILSLFAPEGPRDLTVLDTNFLRTLYRLPLDRTAIAHRGLLVRGLVNAEEK